jgi:Tol biopolymer transport system component
VRAGRIASQAGVLSAALALAAMIAALPAAGALAGPVQVTDTDSVGAASFPVPPTAARADSLIRPGENHFAGLWQLTFGGENAEAYWSGDGSKVIFQATREGWPCDQMFVMDLTTGAERRVSTGRGRCTCGYFYDDDRRILFASTHLAGDSCPPMPDYSHGYVWPVYPGYDIFTAKPDGSDPRRLTATPGYDAEATLSVDGRWIVFTSVRDGDLEIYKMHPDGSAVTRLTHEPGYDGGPYFSHDGKWICYRAYHPADSALAEYRGLLSRHLVRPTQMDLWVMRSDGSDKRQITHDPGASFAPYFTPDDRALIYSTNREHPRGRDFDVYLVPLDPPGTPEPVTRDPLFDGFPMFSPDGKWLLFESNRGHRAAHETNIFLARWRP